MCVVTQCVVCFPLHSNIIISTVYVHVHSRVIRTYIRSTCIPCYAYQCPSLSSLLSTIPLLLFVVRSVFIHLYNCMQRVPDFWLEVLWGEACTYVLALCESCLLCVYATNVSVCANSSYFRPSIMRWTYAIVFVLWSVYILQSGVLVNLANAHLLPVPHKLTILIPQFIHILKYIRSCSDFHDKYVYICHSPCITAVCAGHQCSTMPCNAYRVLVCSLF